MKKMEENKQDRESEREKLENANIFIVEVSLSLRLLFFFFFFWYSARASVAWWMRRLDVADRVVYRWVVFTKLPKPLSLSLSLSLCCVWLALESLERAKESDGSTCLSTSHICWLYRSELMILLPSHAQSPRHQATRTRQDDPASVSALDVVDGANESVISATERIVIQQQQSNNLKVRSRFFVFCFSSLLLFVCFALFFPPFWFLNVFHYARVFLVKVLLFDPKCRPCIFINPDRTYYTTGIYNILYIYTRRPSCSWSSSRRSPRL